MPVNSRARVCGVLDTLTVSTRAFVLRVKGGRALSGAVGNPPLEELKNLLGAYVVVEGVGTFAPSGEVVHIDAAAVSAATAADGPFENMPCTAPPTSGLDPLFGKWPGDETDAQLNEAMRLDS